MPYSNNQPRNIVVTGFMGTGKTAVGRMLAERLGWDWVDTDALLEARHGSIPKIFTTHGEAAFRDLERGLAAELARHARTVISSGGGMMVDPANVRMLAPRNRVFCLVAAPEEILERVASHDSVNRPLLADPDPMARIEQLLAARRPAYSRFAAVSASQPADEVVAELQALLDLPPTQIDRRRKERRSPRMQVGIGLLPFIGGPAPLIISDQPVADLHGPLFGPNAHITTIEDASGTPPLTEATAIIGLGGRTVQAAIDDLAGDAQGLTVLRAPTSPATIVESAESTQPVAIDLVTLQTLPEGRRGPWGLSYPPSPGGPSAVQHRIAEALAGA